MLKIMPFLTMTLIGILTVTYALLFKINGISGWLLTSIGVSLILFGTVFCKKIRGTLIELLRQLL
ncbi:MAG: hypothetical protein ACOZCL_19390 [Bacillota bacterium]